MDFEFDAARKVHGSQDLFMSIFQPNLSVIAYSQYFESCIVSVVRKYRAKYIAFGVMVWRGSKWIIHY